MIEWVCKNFVDFSNIELHEIYKLRIDVFVVEQGCIYQDLDDFDPVAWHLCGWNNVDGEQELLAYLRILPPGTKYPEPSIGRLLTRASARGSGLGQELLRQGLIQSAQHYPNQGNRIAAQAHLESFYQRFGFATVSESYLEDGILHVDMLWVGK